MATAEAIGTATTGAPRRDRFGNVLDPKVGYARGKVITDEVAEAKRQQRAYGIVRRRFERLGDAGVYNLTGLIRAFPIEEPRFVRRQGTRTFMDYTRLTQNGRYSGWIELDGERRSIDGFVGTRDRSWGVRPVGARDSQDVVPQQLPQFYWLWSPSSFEDGSFFFHSNEDGVGRAWNTRAVWCKDGDGEDGRGAAGEGADHCLVPFV
jgi:hypothetical protein